MDAPEANAYDRAMDVRVRFQPSGRSVPAAAGSLLIDAVTRGGLPLASACGADGLCGRCGVRILAGASTLAPESADERRIKQRNRIDAEFRLACRTVVRGDLEITATYW